MEGCHVFCFSGPNSGYHQLGEFGLGTTHPHEVTAQLSARTAQQRYGAFAPARLPAPPKEREAPSRGPGCEPGNPDPATQGRDSYARNPDPAELRDGFPLKEINNFLGSLD